MSYYLTAHGRERIIARELTDDHLAAALVTVFRATKRWVKRTLSR